MDFPGNASASGAASESQPAQAPKGPKPNYYVRRWRGHLSLATSYLTDGFLGARGMIVVIAVSIGCSGIPSRTGNDALGHYQVRVMRHATELEVVGPMGWNLANRVREQLDTHPTITRIHLNSEGGSIVEARALAKLIEERGLITYTASGCAGACILPFAAGRLRLINAYALLGFHRYGFQGLPDANVSSESARDKTYLLERGVQAAFIDHAFSRPDDEVWTPTHAELISAGIVTRRSFLDEFAVTGFNPDQPQSIDSVLTRNPIFLAMKEVDPLIYAELVEDVKDAYSKGRTPGDVLRRFDPRISELESHRLPYASDEAVLEVYALLVAKLKVLHGADPYLCTRWMLSKGPALDVWAQGLMPEELIRRNLVAVSNVLRTGKDKAYPLSDKAAATLWAEGALASLRAQYGDEVNVLGYMMDTDSRNDPEAGCRMWILFYSEVLKLPAPQAAAAFRYLFTP